MERETALLRAELSKVERGRGKRFSRELRERVIEVGARRRAEGVSWQRIGREFGMNYETVRRWCIEKRPSALRQVEMVPTELEPSRIIILVSPSAFRAEGLPVRAAVMMLATLR